MINLRETSIFKWFYQPSKSIVAKEHSAQEIINQPQKKIEVMAQKEENKEDCIDVLEIMYDQVCEFGKCKNFQIFGYLCKDLMDYLTNRGYADEASDTFRQAYIRAMGRDRFYWENCCPVVLGDPCQLEMPTGFTQMAVNGNHQDIFSELQEIEPCDCKNVDGTPPTYPSYLGWCFFREYAPSFGTFLSGFEKDDGEPKKDEILRLAKHLLGNAVPDKLHWYLVILYVSILLCTSNFELIPRETIITEDNIF